MTVTTPRSVRFEADVTRRLTSYVMAHPGLSAGSATNRFVDEGLRMEEHPGIFFRSGPAGRRAVLVGGPDVWEVIRTVHSAREAEPKATRDDIIDLVADTGGIAHRLIRIAVEYWSAYPEEIEATIAAADLAASQAYERAERERELLQK